MKTVKGSTTNETKLIKAMQTVISANADGQIGAQTLSDIACKLGAVTEPLTLQIYGAPVIIARDILPVAASNTGASKYSNCVSGSFTVPQAIGGRVPISICVTGGEVKRAAACHALDGYPESVLYRLKNGTFGMCRVVNADKLPDGVSWAVGGVGLLDFYDPDKEGFKELSSGDYSDVLRDTDHTMVGIKNGHVYLVFCVSMSGPQVNAFAKQLGLEKAVMMDGGHIAAINGGEAFARINIGQNQGYILQAI